MGFTSGFLGGLTLTYSLLYLSLHLHRSNRNGQRKLLSQQSILLDSLLDPQPLSSPSSQSASTSRSRPRPKINLDTLEVEVDDEVRRRESLTEVLKDRWNAEMEGMVRRVQETDWREVRERWESRGVNFWRNMTTKD